MTALDASLRYQPQALWFYVIKLLRLRWLIFVTGFRRAKPLRKILTMFLGLLFLGAFIGSYLLTYSFLRLLNSPIIVESGINLGAALAAIPALIVSAAFLLILMTSFRLLLQALYLAHDMEFLLAAPIPARAVFLTKLLEAILPNFLLILLIALPVLFGVGTARAYQVLYFPLVFVVLAFLSLAAAGISSLLVMAVVRIFPAKRVADVLAFLGAILVMVLAQWRNLTGTEFGPVSPEQIATGAQALSAFNSGWSPLAWGGRGLVDLGEGRWLPGIFWLALMLALCGGVFWLSLSTAERLYISGWASLQVESQRKKPLQAVKPREMSRPGASIFRRLLPRQVMAIMLKDSIALRRDLSHMSQMITPLIMGIVFAVMLVRWSGEPPAGKGEAPQLFMNLFRTGLAYGSVAISVLVGWALISRLALISFSMEGKSYWVIKASPISAGNQLAAKFLIAYLPALILGWLFLLGITVLQKASPATLLYGLPSVAFVLAGLGGINLALGVRGANLNWTDPRRMESGIAGCLGMMASAVYQLGILLLFFAPPIGLPLLGIPELTGQIAGLLLGGTIAMLCTILPLVLVKDRVYRIGEE